MREKNIAMSFLGIFLGTMVFVSMMRCDDPSFARQAVKPASVQKQGACVPQKLFSKDFYAYKAGPDGKKDKLIGVTVDTCFITIWKSKKIETASVEIQGMTSDWGVRLYKGFSCGAGECTIKGNNILTDYGFVIRPYYGMKDSKYLTPLPTYRWTNPKLLNKGDAE